MALPLPPNSVILFGAILLLLIWFIRLNAPKAKSVLWKGTLFGRKVSIGLPARAEQIVLALYLISFAIFDIAQNQMLLAGIDHQVIVFGNITARVLYVWQIFLILMHIFLVMMFVLSLRSKATHRSIDIFVGSIALFGVAILLAGIIVQIYSPTIDFLFIEGIRSIDFYHSGVYAQIFAALYWAFTK